MDERDRVRQRDAVVGLGLLGVLTSVLVGTIVFRIVNAAPRQTPSGAGVVWADAAPLPAVDEGGVIQTSGEIAAPATAPAAEASAVAADSNPATSGADHFPPQSSDETVNVLEESPRPVFVAPATR